MRREPREDAMIGMRRVLVLAAAGILSAAASLSAQVDAPNPFAQPRPELRQDAGRHRHHGRALERHGRRREWRGERMERLGERMEHRGRRMERRGLPYRGQVWRRKGERRERWGERHRHRRWHQGHGDI
jgi:hypothetical protein